MAVISTPNATSVKIKLDHGADVNGDRIIKTKTLTNIKSTASNDDIMAAVNAIVDLQKHTLSLLTEWITHLYLNKNFKEVKLWKKINLSWSLKILWVIAFL